MDGAQGLVWTLTQTRVAAGGGTTTGLHPSNEDLSLGDLDLEMALQSYSLQA